MITMAEAREKRQGRKLTGERNQCAECGELFNSTGAFDKHRVGSFGDAAGALAQRRCLTVEQMLAAGMTLNKAGFWITARMTGEGIARRGAATVDKAVEFAQSEG